MRTILVPTDDRELVAEILTGYHENQCEVVAGAINFWQRQIKCDVLHLLWPEELSHWKSPSPKELQLIDDCLRHWSQICPVVFTVNNIYPHGFDQDRGYFELYSMILTHATLTVHHSSASRRLIEERYPAARNRRSLVTTMFAYHDHLCPDADRGLLRNQVGVNESEFVFLIFGALRTREEAALVRNAYALCNVPKKRLVVASRFTPEGSPLVRTLSQTRWSFWLRRNSAIVQPAFVPSDEIYKFFEATDAVIIPRIDDLSSGVVGLAMAFGKLIIAPNHGGFPDYLDGTPNLLYRSGSAESLAAQMANATNVSSDAVRDINQNHCREWTWTNIARDILSNLDRDGPAV